VKQNEQFAIFFYSVEILVIIWPKNTANKLNLQFSAKQGYNISCLNCNPTSCSRGNWLFGAERRKQRDWKQVGKG